MVTTIRADSVIQRTKNHLDTQLDDEVILMQIESGQIYGMAETAEVIWGQLSEPATFGQLIDHLVEQFDVDRGTCITEVSQFLFDLEKQKFVEINIASVTT